MKTIAALLCRIACGTGLVLQCAGAVQAAPACVDPGGIGGTGAPTHEGGIGGTGAPARAPGGIGGTGAPSEAGGIGGTGIVGTITGFASICVNGVEVHYDETVPLTENGASATTARLAVGQVVAVEAGASSRGLEARRISILNAYEGPLTALPTAAAPLRVMDRPVQVAPGAHVDAGLQAGDAVRVSGLRDARGTVVATRIERAPQAIEATSIGFADRPGSLQGLPLAGRPVAAGEELLVRGRWAAGRLEVSSAFENPAIPFAGRVQDVVVEGLVGDHDDRKVSIGGFSVELQPRTVFAGGAQTDLTQDRRIRVHGALGERREIRANRVEFVREFGGSGDGRGRGPSGSSRKQGDDGEHSESATTRVDSDDNRLRIETDDAGGRERIEQRMTDSGEIERQRIEREIVDADGELVRRERIEIKNSGDRSEIRERIEVYDGGKRIDRIETIERIDRPTKTERPERIDRSGREDRPERTERSGRH